MQAYIHDVAAAKLDTKQRLQAKLLQKRVFKCWPSHFLGENFYLEMSFFIVFLFDRLRVKHWTRQMRESRDFSRIKATKEG